MQRLSVATHFHSKPNASRLKSRSEGWAVGSDGLIVHDLGGTWRQVSSPTDQTLWSLAMVSPTKGRAVGEQGTILCYSHGAWGLYRG